MLKIKIISTDLVFMKFPYLNFISCKRKMTLVTENAVHTLGLTTELTALTFYFSFKYRHKLTNEQIAKSYAQNFLNILLHYWF